MIVSESQRGRRLVGRLDKGSELVAAIASVCQRHRVKSGELRAFGIVEEAELREYDPRTRADHAARRFSAPMTIVHLGGHISEMGGALHVEATCALSREGENGIELVGGRLASARVFAVKFVIDCFDDLLLRSSVDAATGLPQWNAVVTAQSADSQPQTATLVATPQLPASALGFEAAPLGHVVSRAPAHEVTERHGAAEPTWAEVAARSAEQGPVGSGEGEGGDDEGLRAGDVIEHPRFGRCHVERIEGAGEYAQVRLRNRRLVRLSLDVLQLQRDGKDESGQRRFRARVST